MHDPNLTEQEELLAARYALGVATIGEIAQVHARFERDDQFSDLVAAFSELFSEIEIEGDTLVPPSRVWKSIDAALDEMQTPPIAPGLSAPQPPWVAIAPGIERKPLYGMIAERMSMALYRVAPGACLAATEDPTEDACLLLDGEVEVNGVTLRAEDMTPAPVISRQGTITSRTGAILYVRANTSTPT